jgi:hypothetical protein
MVWREKKEGGVMLMMVCSYQRHRRTYQGNLEQVHGPVVVTSDFGSNAVAKGKGRGNFGVEVVPFFTVLFLREEVN